MIGKKGVKRMQQVVLREGEWVDRFGSVQEKAHREDRRKRNHSGGSPSQARDKRGFRQQTLGRGWRGQCRCTRWPAWAGGGGADTSDNL